MANATRLLVLTTVLAGTAAFVAGLFAMAHPGPFLFDERVAHALQRLPAGFGEFASLPGDWRVATPAAAGVALLAWRLGSASIVAAAVAAEAARFVNHVWKELVERPRPTAGVLTIRELAEGWSYPSGHAYTAALVFGLLALLAVTRLRGLARWLTATAAVAAVLLTGAGRVVTGAHWPSDVLGGWLAGTATATACLLIFGRVLGASESPITAVDLT